MISSVLKPDSDAVRDFAGFVIASDRENFSVGANLMQLLLAAQEGEWDELAAVIHAFQQMTAAIKFCPRPVVAAPFGLTLGGGAEIACTPRAASPMRRLTSAWSRPACGPDSRRRRHQGDAAARRRWTRPALAPPDPKDPPSRFAQSAEMARRSSAS
jgi:3-hydroxyacyl-CoA dehydrogenase